MKILTWNIQWGRGADGRVDIGRIATEIERLGMPELVCLQEVASGFGDDELPGCDGSDQFHGLAGLLPVYQPAAGIAVDMPGSGPLRRRFGNMLLSRYPVGLVRSHLLPWPPDPGVRSMQRVALEVLVESPLGLLRVTTTHLEYYSRPQRTAQVEHLRDLHEAAWAHEQHPRLRLNTGSPYDGIFGGCQAILAGDFNCGPSSLERSLLCSPRSPDTPRLVDAWSIAHTGRTHPMTAGLYDRAQWQEGPVSFDTIFVTEGLASRVRTMVVDPETIASDHQPVVLELTDNT